MTSPGRLETDVLARIDPRPKRTALTKGENGTIPGRRNPGPEQPTPEVDTGLSLGVVGPVDLVDDSDDLGK